MVKVTEALLHMYEKHKEYLQEQVERCDYLDGKYRHRDDNHYGMQSQAYENALDNLKSLFGENDCECIECI